MPDARGSKEEKAAASGVKARPLIVQPLWDRLDQAVIVTDCNLDAPGPTILYVNRAFTALTGYRADEAIGRSPRFLQCPRTDPVVAATIRQELLEGEFARCTLVNRRKDGTEYLCSLVITPLVGPRGDTEHFICVAENLKEDRTPEAMKRLSAELEQAQTLIEDMERRQSEAEEEIDRQRRDLAIVTERYRDSLAQLDAIQERLAIRENALERSGREIDRSDFELHASLEELRAMDEELRATLEQMEEANIQLGLTNEELRRLQAADADKLQLLASASHDLRQPVMSMGLFLDVLRNRLGEAERPIMGGLLAAHLSIRTLLEGMLDTARLDAGAMEPIIEPLPIALMLEMIHGEFLPQAEMRGLRFRAVSSGAIVLSDAQLLERILRNLVANALKYAVSGTILMGCRRCRDHLRIEVWDTGPGIPEASQKSIFEEFRQLDNPGRDQARGVGLGLAIVARLSRRLGHEIGLRSWPGRGSVFSITLPLAQPGKRRRRR
ncbi:PAS domain-containing protein [Azospirillum sp. YIM B02556]|uniref:histidine kinase n=1 Tax=Azospirillum endophyticum TaxID=2800326 RepID=A0ABS1FHH1_9PROT|nr:PAS domain-containing protein [Azospirillum endophyticum]